MIRRPGNPAEMLLLLPSIRHHHKYISQETRAEPHKFDATLQLSAAGQTEELAFHLAKPESHHHRPQGEPSG